MGKCQEKLSTILLHDSLVLGMAWKGFILPLVRNAFWHYDCLSNLNFHMYNITHKHPKVKKNFQLFSYTMLLV
ncbi:MAG: hypothetical protein CL512_05815 [Actinobacteria bacterium]|nr:hypothetical protein [Actinomycetota bacterium]